MPPVFGRNLPDPHPYDVAISSMLSKTVGERAMAINLMSDYRVSAERERAFDSYVRRPCTDFLLRSALKDYFETQVRPRKRPDYVYNYLNGNNILNGYAYARPIIKPDVQLVRVLDLNGLKHVFQWAQTEGRRSYPARWGSTFDTFPRDVANDRAVMDFLDRRMGRRTVGDFVRTVLDVLSVHSTLEKKPFQPTWATTWTAFREHITGGANRWLEVIGISKRIPCWLILLKYTVREAGTVVRPTQLDGGWYQFHFPSPPRALLSRGGHPMDLRTSPRAVKLLPEYIHKQIHHPIEHWTNITPDSNYGRSSALVSTSLSKQRQAHYGLLASTYGSSILRWMKRAI